MPHHAEGRTVTIDYGSLRLGDRKLSVPMQVIVRRDTDGTVLRSARLFNFVRSRQNAAECRQEAERFAYLDTGEEKCRQMFIRYWLKDPADLSRADANDLRQLRATLEARPTSEMVIGQKLRRINKLFELDWLLGDAVALERHFDEYLAILIENKLEKMVLFGGQHAIEVTVRWGLLRVAGRMLEKWVDAATDVHDPDSIVAFSDAQIRRGVLWPIARLLEVSRTAAKEPGERFEVEALRYKALLRLMASIENAERGPSNDFAIMQAGWVVSAVGMDHLSRMTSKSLKNAEESYARLDEPSQRQKVVITQVRNMKNAMEGQPSARKRRTMPVD